MSNSILRKVFIATIVIFLAFVTSASVNWKYLFRVITTSKANIVLSDYDKEKVIDIKGCGLRLHLESKGLEYKLTERRGEFSLVFTLKSDPFGDFTCEYSQSTDSFFHGTFGKKVADELFEPYTGAYKAEIKPEEIGLLDPKYHKYVTYAHHLSCCTISKDTFNYNGNRYILGNYTNTLIQRIEILN